LIEFFSFYQYFYKEGNLFRIKLGKITGKIIKKNCRKSLDNFDNKGYTIQAVARKHFKNLVMNMAE